MELKDFVSTVLVSIVKGVEEAQKELSQSEAIINPGGLKSKIETQELKEGVQHTMVQFEVSVIAENTEHAGISGGIKLAGVQVGGKTSSSDKESEINKIAFSVPVHLPPGKFQELYSKK